LSGDPVEAGLPPGYSLVHYDSIGSTNDEAKRLAREGAETGTVVWALEQTAGRGRRGRTWVSPRGNLYTSLLLRPACPAGRAAQLGFVAAVAIGGALAELLRSPRGLSYKWPNDVLVNNRKVAGILLESEMTAADKLDFVVVGVGINLLTAPLESEFPATSILQEGLGKISPLAMLAGFVGHFRRWERCWGSDGFEPVRTVWRAAAAGRGEPVRVRLETATLHGHFLDIDEQGAMLLDAAGERRRITAGEVFPANR